MTQAVVQVRNIVARSGFANPLTLEVLVTDEDYLKVYADTTLLDNGPDYEITGIGDPNGISIEIIGAEDVDNYVGVLTFTALYEPPLDQQSDLSAGGVLGRGFETGLDQQNRRMQALGDRVNRAIKLPVTIDGDIVLDEPIDQWGLVWDDVTQRLIWAAVNDAGAQAAALPSGGTTGQLLAKTSDTDFDTEWIDGAFTAVAISFASTGGLSATNVQAALAELDSEKLSAAAADALFLTSAEGNAAYQPKSANLDEYAAVNPTAAGLALLDDADAAAQRTTMFVQRRHSVDIMEFGASGAGILDDGPEFNTAIATIDNAEGGELLISVPTDHYQIDTSVTITADYPVTLKGVGQPELRTNLSGQAIVIGSGAVSNQGFVSLRDFKLWGDASSVTGIKGNYAVNLEMEGLSLYQLGTLGVYLDNCYTFRLDRSQFNDCGDAGLYVTGASMNSAVVSRSKFVNHANGGSACGISIAAGGSVHYGGLITDCDFEMNDIGINAADVSGLHIANCYFEQNTKHINATTTCDNIKITDCQFLSTGVVDLSDVDGVTLDNLVFYGTGTVLDLTGCTNVTIGRLYFPNGGTVAGLDDQRLVGHYAALNGALNQNPRLQVHTTDAARPASAFYRWSADNGGPSFSFAKSRGATPGTHTIVQSGDSLGSVIFRAADGSGDFWNSASFGAAVDGTPGVGDMPGRLVFNTAADGSTSLVERMRVDSRGHTSLTGSFGRGAPVTKTANFTVADTENYLINNKSGSSCTVTLPTASAWTGREIMIKNIQAQTVVSASSNVVPLAGGSAGTAILAALAGRWCTLVSDGTNWVQMEGVV